MSDLRTIEIWDLPKKAFSISGGNQYYRAYAFKNVKGNTTQLYAWIPDYQYDGIVALTNPLQKGGIFKGYANTNHKIESIINKLELPSFEEISSLYNQEITAENVNGLTEEELAAKYKLSDLAQVIVKLCLQNEYYNQIITELQSNEEDKTSEIDIQAEYEKLKLKWSHESSFPNFQDYLEALRAVESDPVKYKVITDIINIVIEKAPAKRSNRRKDKEELQIVDNIEKELQIVDNIEEANPKVNPEFNPETITIGTSTTYSVNTNMEFRNAISESKRGTYDKKFIEEAEKSIDEIIKKQYNKE